MKIKLYGFENELEIQNGLNVITIENVKLFSSILFDLVNNEEHTAIDIIDEEFNKIKTAKLLDYVFNPLQIDFNSKKIQNALYSEIGAQVVADESIYANLFANANNMFSIINSIESDVDFELDIEQNVNSIFKFLNLKIKHEPKDVMDNIYKLIDVYSRWFSASILCFVNLTQFLTNQEIAELNKYCIYKNVKIIVFQNSKIDLEINEMMIESDFSDYIC